MLPLFQEHMNLGGLEIQFRKFRYFSKAAGLRFCEPGHLQLSALWLRHSQQAQSRTERWCFRHRKYPRTSAVFGVRPHWVFGQH